VSAQPLPHSRCSPSHVLPHLPVALSGPHISMLTHGHASPRPRKRPCFGAEPAQSIESRSSHSGSQKLANCKLDRKLRALAAVHAWPLSPSQAPGATFQGCLQNQPRSTLKGDHSHLLCPAPSADASGLNPTRAWSLDCAATRAPGSAITFP
jgi:hypothetical protein